jgi:hypothetical protein
MRFFAVDQMPVKSKGIVWSDGSFIVPLAIILVLIDTRGVMIDDYNGSPMRVGLNGRFLKSSFVQKPAQTGDLFYFEVVGMRALEECALRPDHKCELVVPMGLDFTYLSN